MKRINCPETPERSPQGFEAVSYQRNSFVESVLTDAAMDELKKQSANGCLLCSLDALDEEEWE